MELRRETESRKGGNNSVNARHSHTIHGTACIMGNTTTGRLSEDNNQGHTLLLWPQTSYIHNIDR